MTARNRPIVFAALAEMDTFVTDTSLDDETVAEIEAAGPEVICA